jgi:hypothetical protein
MRRSRFLLYLSLALSGLVCSGSNAGAARVTPMRCYSQLETIHMGQTFPGTNFLCWGPTCICLVTTCPQLCRVGQGYNRLCTFVSHCVFPTGP